MSDISDFDILTLPGWHNSEPEHWQSHWQAILPNVVRVEQRDWETPLYADWATNLTEAVSRCARPVLLVAHSLGVSLVMRWSQTANVERVAGAFLVAPSDRDRFDGEPDAPVKGFAPMMLRPIPFPTTVLASRTDHRVSFERATEFAKGWGSRLVDTGDLGHMDTELGLWPQGLVWFGQFVGSLPDRRIRPA